MFKSIAVACAFVLALFSPLAAQTKPDDIERCIGPMCLLTSIYRLGQTLMPSEAPKTTPAVEPSPAPASDQHQDAAPQTDGVVPQPVPSTPAKVQGDNQDASPENAAPHVQENSGGNGLKPLVAAHRLASNERRRPSSKAHVLHYATRPFPRPTRFVRTQIAPVTILADDPERSRIRELASVVKTPSIDIIPASEGVDACTHKPADFVVDTLQDPARLGPAIPLFSESLIIAARNVTDIRRLAGKHVSFGTPGGSSERTAQRLFSFLRIDVSNTPLDTDNALDALASGDLDAVAVLVPRGYTGLINNDPTLHLLSLDADMLPPGGLKLSRIDPASYLGASWPRTPVEVVTVDAVLSLNPKAAHDRSALSLYAALDRKAATLAQNGFDLIGGDAVVTMRSVAKDADPTRERPSPPRSAFVHDGC